MLVVTKSLCGYVSNQVQYNIIYYIIMIINKYILDIYIYIFNSWKIFCNLRFHEVYKTTFIMRTNFYLLRTFRPHLGRVFCVCACVVSSFTTFRPNFTSGLLQVLLPRPRIGMLSLVTVSPVITAIHSCLSHHVFNQVNLWPAWVGFETAIFWQCSPGTVETQRLYPLRYGPRRAIKDFFV